LKIDEEIVLVPVKAVFTKYDQFRHEISFKLEDNGLNPSTVLALLNTEAEKVFKEQYLANLTKLLPFVCLEGVNFINQLRCIMLILSCRDTQGWSTVYQTYRKDSQ
jgi:hypothetical protein